MRAAVFDFDGVLCDSMRQHVEAYRQVLAPEGVVVEPHQIYAREGARSESIIAELLNRPVAEVKDLSERKQQIFASLGTPSLYPDAPHLVTEVRAAVDGLALVTGTRKANVKRLMPGLVEHFDVILAQEDYSHDKPHPEPYAKAAEHLGMDASECMALENAVRGVQSAKAAGYGAVLGISTTMPAQALSEAGASPVVSDHQSAARVMVARARR